eukprot:1155928-Pelagomonas_calceolata.AAC.4
MLPGPAAAAAAAAAASADHCRRQHITTAENQHVHKSLRRQITAGGSASLLQEISASTNHCNGRSLPAIAHHCMRQLKQRAALFAAPFHSTLLLHQGNQAAHCAICHALSLHVPLLAHALGQLLLRQQVLLTFNLSSRSSRSLRASPASSCLGLLLLPQQALPTFNLSSRSCSLKEPHLLACLLRLLPLRQHVLQALASSPRSFRSYTSLTAGSCAGPAAVVSAGLPNPRGGLISYPRSSRPVTFLPAGSGAVPAAVASAGPRGLTLAWRARRRRAAAAAAAASAAWFPYLGPANAQVRMEALCLCPIMLHCSGRQASMFTIAARLPCLRPMSTHACAPHCANI